MSNRLSRDDRKKAQELEELRKTGAAPPEVDEDGKMINPHIPQYVSQAPWYLNHTRPGLKHQRSSNFKEKAKMDGMDAWYERGTKVGKASKFRKGACQNCGAMTHRKADCLERPRKRGAELTGKNIVADEKIQPGLRLDYDGKRDRWNGYNPTEYKRVIEHYEKVETQRRVKKKQELDQKFKDKSKTRALKKAKKAEEKTRLRKERAEKLKAVRAKKAAEAIEKGEAVAQDDSPDDDTDTDTDTDTDDETDDEDEGDELLKDETGMVMMSRSDTAKHTTNRTTARNLRIREDTAKYLRNLNIHSAYYDPKTRSMRENPHPEKDPNELIYAGDNFIRSKGDVNDVKAQRMFTFEANDAGNEKVHMMSNPSQAELLFEQYKEKKAKLKVDKRANVLAKYGGAEHLEAPPLELVLGESEAYTEYSETGQVVKGQEKVVPSTRYPENKLENNHSKIWGSYFKSGRWGFACCHQTTRNAYCTGGAGVNAAKGSLTMGDVGKRKAVAPVPQFSASAKRTKTDQA
jgi:pre-mRNA-processing factor SLU7